MRAWVVGHDGFRVGVALLAVGLAVSVYAFVRVPSPYGGPIPMWFLTPPALATLSALSVRNEIPVVGWADRRLRRARLGWALAVTALTGACAALVGANAGQDRLPELTMTLTGLTFGAAVAVGRGSAALGAACLVAVVGSTVALHDLTPARIWDHLAWPGQTAAAIVCAVAVTAYARFGAPGSAGGLSG